MVHFKNIKIHIMFVIQIPGFFQRTSIIKLIEKGRRNQPKK